MFALGPVQDGLSSVPRCVTHMEFSSFIIGSTRFVSLPLVFGGVSSDAFTLLEGAAQLGASFGLTGFHRMDSPIAQLFYSFRHFHFSVEYCKRWFINVCR